MGLKPLHGFCAFMRDAGLEPLAPRMFELGLWQLLLQVGIGAATQSYNGMPDLAKWTPTRRSHQAASRSQARACRRSSYSMMRPGLAQCDSVLQLGVGPGRRLVFERPRNGERATLWVDKHRVLQAQEGVDPIAITAITRRCAVWGCC